MFEIPISTALTKDVLGPRRLSEISKVWCPWRVTLAPFELSGCHSRVSKHFVKFVGQQWFLLSQRYCHCVQFDEKWAFIGKGTYFVESLSSRLAESPRSNFGCFPCGNKKINNRRGCLLTPLAKLHLPFNTLPRVHKPLLSFFYVFLL